MRRGIWALILLISVCPGTAAADLVHSSGEELLGFYTQLRQLRLGDQSAVTENVVWKRDAATFTFREGRLSFAAPVEGHVLGAVFEGQGTFTLDPPTATDRQQISRFTKSPKLEDQFGQALFFFTDDSWSQLQKVLDIQTSSTALAGEVLSSTQKRYAENCNDWWGNEAKGNFQMRNLAARMLADLTDPTSRGFFLADLKGDRHGDLLCHISWNRDPLLLPGLGNDEEVMLLHYNLGNYYEWWAGFHLQDEYVRSPRPEHRQPLAHCRRERIDAEVTKDNRLTAAAEMEFEVLAGPARLLPLHLRGVLRISSVQDAEGKKWAFIQEDRELDNDPWVILPEPAKPGQVYKVRITYAEDSSRDSRIIHQASPGLYYVAAREAWFPSFGAFDDRTQYVMRIRSPKRFKFVGTGRQVRAEKKKEFLETEWESEIPYSVVGFNYGNFVDKSRADPNFTVTAYSGREIPEELRGFQQVINTAELRDGTQASRDISRQQVVAIGGLSTAVQVGVAAATSYQALKLFEYYFGPLPFKAVSVTEQPVRGYGQSWPTLILLPYDSLLDATTRQGLPLQETAEERVFYNIVAVHEMAHQWWGHLVGAKTYHDQWLSEGFAEFSAALYLRKFEPHKVRAFWDLKRKSLLSKNRKGNHPVDVGPLWLNHQLDAYLEEDNSRHLVCFKGAYVLEMLRALMEDQEGTEPDARFIAMTRDFLSTYAGKNASTEDFRRLVEKHVGEPMDWFFDEWVYGREIPEYELRYQMRDAEEGKTQLEFSLTQSGVSESFRARVPLFFFVNNRARRLGFVNINGASTFAGSVVLPVRPEKVTLDETRSILCTIRQ